jgi:hypothetical protein
MFSSLHDRTAIIPPEARGRKVSRIASPIGLASSARLGLGFEV